jgi:hypothetical protein
VIAALAGIAWASVNLPGWARFRAALAAPERLQRDLLARYLRENAETVYGRAHGFASLHDVADYQERVPLTTWADYRPLLERIGAGEPDVLTRSPVRVLEGSGGTTQAKLVPYTDALQAELRRAVAPWILDLARQHPGLLRGRSYWAITPVARAAEGAARPARGPADSAGPRVGFEQDSEYLGGAASRLVDATLVVPGAVRHIPDVASFRYATLLFLLRAPDLTLISVWHPSFLTLLLEALPGHWDRLLADLAAGTLTPPSPLPAPLRAALSRPAAVRRASKLRALGPASLGPIWPRLRVVSCWGDAHAALHLDGLRRALPGVVVQPKGLLATEACVTIPFEGAWPIAIRSHFFEFVEAGGGRPRLAHELEPGGTYSVVVTTGGGLYRYQLEDRVEVTGRLRATPSLRFLGKLGHLSDRVGEKLREDFVSAALGRVCRDLDVHPRFALLAPDGEGYALFVEAPAVPEGLAAALDAALQFHADYRYARDLGQLRPAGVCRVENGLARYLERATERGQRLGDVKPLALSPLDGWRAWFRC